MYLRVFARACTANVRVSVCTARMCACVPAFCAGARARAHARASEKGEEGRGGDAGAAQVGEKTNTHLACGKFPSPGLQKPRPQGPKSETRSTKAGETGARDAGALHSWGLGFTPLDTKALEIPRPWTLQGPSIFPSSRSGKGYIPPIPPWNWTGGSRVVGQAAPMRPPRSSQKNTRRLKTP